MNTRYGQLADYFKHSDKPAIIFYDGYDYRVSKLENGWFRLEDRDGNSNWFEVKESPFVDLSALWMYVMR